MATTNFTRDAARPHLSADNVRRSHDQFVEYLFDCAQRWRGQSPSQAAKIEASATAIREAGEEKCAICLLAKRTAVPYLSYEEADELVARVGRDEAIATIFRNKGFTRTHVGNWTRGDYSYPPCQATSHFANEFSNAERDVIEGVR